jgi:hypothetical protein
LSNWAPESVSVVWTFTTSFKARNSASNLRLRIINNAMELLITDLMEFAITTSQRMIFRVNVMAKFAWLVKLARL